MRVLIVTPYPLSGSNGNTITAKRLETILDIPPIRAEALHTHTPPPADILINLHATKTFPAAKHFKATNPNAKLITLITGTDLNQHLPAKHPHIAPALELADVIVVPHHHALPELPTSVHAKTKVIPASIVIPELPSLPPLPSPTIILPSHLREVKNPFLLNRALAVIPDLHLHALLLGRELEAGLSQLAFQLQENDQRFRYLGELDHHQTLAHIRGATLTLNTSHQEGGPNAIAESIVLGTPVIASRIAGNVGMLGTTYPGLFTPDDPASLASLIKKFLTDPTFHNLLTQKTLALADHFHPAREQRSWLELLNADRR